jgi:hypothetical protein
VPSVKLINTGSQGISAGQDSGFFTSISSSGAGLGIVWAVSRPRGAIDTSFTLYAVNAVTSSGKLPILLQHPSMFNDTNTDDLRIGTAQTSHRSR